MRVLVLKMALNLCHQQLGTEMVCSQVCSDEYDVHNLIADDPIKRLKGFKVEYFVKPPVDITITFPIPVTIHSIRIGLQLGLQSTSGFEIWSTCNEDAEFQFILKHYSNRSNGVLIKNTRYFPNKRLEKFKLPNQAEDIDVIYVPVKVNHLVKSMSKLKLRLTKACNSGILALSSLDIFGQPHSNNNEAIDKMLLAYQSLHEATEKKQSCNGASYYGSSEQSNKKRKLDVEAKPCMANNEPKPDSLLIPTEFLDPLTNEIMINPTTLPSGQTIDTTTLEKYNANEALYARRANDPFTCKPFERNSEPIINSALKLRIDSFIFTNYDKLGPDVRPTQRCVGTSRHYNYTGTNDEQNQCISCKITHRSSDETIYKLPCEHLVCRQKWLTMTAGKIYITCLKCSRLTKPGEAISFH